MNFSKEKVDGQEDGQGMGRNHLINFLSLFFLQWLFRNPVGSSHNQADVSAYRGGPQ